MSWQRITRAALDALIAEGLSEADDAVLEAWAAMRVEPEKWQCSPWGDEGGGFWVVAIRDGLVTYYNDIEDGFNTSPLLEKGVISEYWCNQNDFKEYLCSLDVAQQAGDWSTRHFLDHVPLQLTGPGRIMRRQTTYWTVLSDTGETWKVHFKDKREMHFGSPLYLDASIMDHHPLLVDHNDEFGSLYFNGRHTDPDGLMQVLKAKVNSFSGGWRSYEHYTENRVLLSEGFGLLMNGPAALLRVMVQVLLEVGMKASIIGPFRTNRAPAKVLLLGISYVIAREFGFERIGDVSN